MCQKIHKTSKIYRISDSLTLTLAGLTLSYTRKRLRHTKTNQVIENNSLNIVRSHLNMLVQLARIDGVVVQEEIDFIKKIGKANGLSNEEISEAFEDPSVIEGLETLTNDQRYDYLYNVVQLMKIDGRIYKEEIKFCARIASKLGYDEDVLREMMLKIYADPHISADKDTLKAKIQTYLKR